MTRPKTKNIIADKLLSVSVGENPVKEYSYDACGRLTAVESSAGVTSLSWDYEDRLIGITYPNQSTNSFAYNPFGARVSKSDSSGASTYFRAGTSVVSPVLSDGSATYTPGISERRNNNSTYYHSDLKNTVAQTNSSEAVSGTNQYDAFGNLLNYTGTWNGPFAYGGAFGYQADDDSGLMLLGHRYYDSSTGRFLSRDPIGDGSNWYVYCGNNPLKFVDFNGLDKILVAVNRGGVTGTHMSIGVQRGSNKPMWYGFYPSDPNVDGSSSGSSKSSSNKSSRGPGYINPGDNPPENATVYWVEVDEQFIRDLERAIVEERRNRNNGKGKQYSVMDFNCVHWVMFILWDAFSKYNPDWLPNPGEIPPKKTLTPNNVKPIFEGHGWDSIGG